MTTLPSTTEPADASHAEPSLCGAYEGRILKSIRQIIRAVDIYSRRLHTQYKITTPQMICLNALVANEAMTLTELGREVGLSASTVNGIVDRLALKGLVVRKRGTEDRRKVYLELTEAGRTLTASAPSLLQDRLSDSLQTLPVSEIETIASSLDRVVSMMEAEHLDASPNLMPGSEVQSLPTDDKNTPL